MNIFSSYRPQSIKGGKKVTPHWSDLLICRRKRRREYVQQAVCDEGEATLLRKSRMICSSHFLVSR